MDQFEGERSNWLPIVLEYDDAGNLRSRGLDPTSGSSGPIDCPDDDPREFHYYHDAWNRLVQVWYYDPYAVDPPLLSKPGVPRATYRYNGLNWRIVKRVDTNRDGDLDQECVMAYSANWQLLEETINDDYPSSSDPTRRVQYLWGLRYIDDIICSREKAMPSSSYVTRYHLTDAQFSTVALISAAGTLLERVTYDAYGEARHQWPGDLNGDGEVTTAEITAIYNIARGSDNNIGQADYDPEADFNRDGVVNVTDYNIAVAQGAKAALPKGDLSAPAIGNTIGYCGYVFNGETITATTGALYTVRHRHYAPDLGRWIERDPIGYVDGMGLYEYVRGRPVVALDPTGLNSCMNECVIGCPRVPTNSSEADLRYTRAVRVRGKARSSAPTKECTARCNTLCSCPSDSCKPKGRIVWGTPHTVQGSSGFGLTIRIVGEDPNCCSEFGIVQFVRTTTYSRGTGDWKIDDGRVGGLSDNSPVPPYYDPPVPIRNPGGSGTYSFADEPESFYNLFREYNILVMCTAGPAAGHIYGMYTWSVGTGWNGVWSDPSSAPVIPSAVPKELPRILQDRCCGKKGKDS